MKTTLRLALAGALSLGSAYAFAQTYQDSGGTIVQGVVPVAPGLGPMFTAARPGYVQGSLSASFSGFTPTPAYASLSVGASSSRVGLPAGTVAIVYNTGANAAYVQLGGSSVVATAANDVIPAGGWMAFTVGTATYIAGIETAGTTTLNVSGGSGLPTGAGGGTGGSGGAVTVTSGTITSNDGGTSGTGISQPTGGVGLSGWLSGIYKALTGTLTVQWSGQSVSISGTPAVAPAADTSGGASFASAIITNNTTAIAIKSGAGGNLYSFSGSHNNSAPVYVKLYDAASAPTCGTGTPVARFEVPAASTAANGGGTNPSLPAVGVSFTNGLFACVTTGIADSDATAPGATSGYVTFGYR